jgi:hypothetical protein
MRFNLRRLLAVVAIYALFLGLLGPRGTAEIVLALLSATALSAAVVLATPVHLVSIVGIVIGAFVGSFLGILLLEPFILGVFYPRPRSAGATEQARITAVIISAFAGAACMSWLLHRFGKRRD